MSATDEKARAWLVLQARDSRYADVEGRSYEFPQAIPNAQRIRTGDLLMVCLPRKDATDGRRIVEIGRVGSITHAGPDRFVAHYDRYLRLGSPATFDEVGGDPRANRTNSINAIDPRVVQQLLARAGLGNPEDMPAVEVSATQTGTSVPSGHELRELLHKAVSDDLLGPASGPEEEILGTSVRDRYLVGKLAPRDLRMGPEEIDDLPGDTDVGSDDGHADEGTLASESLVPSSLGMTFCVDADAKSLTVQASWGHYRRTDSEIHFTDSGTAKKVWKRSTAGGTLSVSLAPGRFGPKSPDPERPDVFVRGVVRSPTPRGEKIVTLFLVNGQEAQKKNIDETWLFQPELVVTAPEAAPIFRRRPAGEADLGDPERTALAMLYRDRVEFAVGHGVSVHAELAPGSYDRAVSIRTVVVPSHDVPTTEAPSVEDVPGFAELERDMRTLAELDRHGLHRSLSVLTREYEGWIEKQAARISQGELAGHEAEAGNALDRCRRTLRRLEEGIRLVTQEDEPHEAFRFANRTMWQQRIHSIYALKRRRGQEVTLEESDVPENRSWRPFQLAYILLVVPALTDPVHPERVDSASAIADLLWFPTGGGKTEAYLGIAAYAIAIRRLQGHVAGHDGSRGLAVIMRYTLRLLTIQQFQRAATLLCAMEVLRREALARGDARWGATPFRIGLWVGQRATPNTTEDAAQAIANAHGDQWRTTGTGTPAQLTSCPWCGEEIRPGRDIKVSPFKNGIGRTLMFCSDKYGTCPFTAARANNEGLPVVVVDEEIYRLLPDMLVATVDKFAQMPWKGEVQTLFGRVTGYCPRHGFLTPESDDTGNHRQSGSLPATKREETPLLRPPDLIIQDELHLISGPLGTLVGLYETAVDGLASWECNGKKVVPKVIASTATIRRALEQVHGIFLRRVEIFPPHGLEAADNFFARQRPVSPAKPGRRYIGICAPGQSRPSVLIRVYVAFLTAAKNLYDQHGTAADPWMTLVGYFNSLRELGGMRRLAEDDVRTRAFRVTLGELERPGLAQRDVRQIRELTSRASSADIPRILDLLEVGFPPPGEKPVTSPIDIVLATNMVSVGVDIQRLGMMVVNGQPKTTAEYIQSTSRVGRQYLGMVCAVLNWSRPRDLSHYESFEHYHATFYQHVEALSVTPFAPRALDRGLTGVLASVIRLRDFEYNPNEGAGRLVDPGSRHAVEAASAVAARAWGVTDAKGTKEFVEQMLRQRIDGWCHEAQRGGRTLGYRARRDGTTVGLLRRPGPSAWELFTTPTSMREVEAAASLLIDTGTKTEGPEWRRSESPVTSDGEATS